MTGVDQGPVTLGAWLARMLVAKLLLLLLLLLPANIEGKEPKETVCLDWVESVRMPDEGVSWSGGFPPSIEQFFG